MRINYKKYKWRGERINLFIMLISALLLLTPITAMASTEELADGAIHINTWNVRAENDILESRIWASIFAEGEMNLLTTMYLDGDIAIKDDDNIIVAMYSATPTTYFTFNSDTQTIITYSSSTEAPKEVVIPAQIGGYDVLHIASYAFAGFQLTGVEFEEGSKLQTIGTYAFYNNLNLKGEVIIPDSVETVGRYAFLWTNIYALYLGPDTSYTNGSTMGIIQDYINESISTTNKAMSDNETALIIDNNYIYDAVNAVLIDPETDTLIRHYPEHIDNATSVTVPEGVVHIAEQAYYQDTHISEVKFPSTLETIGEKAFYQITIVELDFSSTNLKRIEAYAFYQCKSLVAITPSKSLEYIGNYGFYQCTILEEIIEFENCNLEELGTYVFYQCYALDEVNLPDTLHTLGRAVFQGIPITELVLPKLVEIIPQDMVKACTSLLEVIWEGDLKEIGQEAFGGTTSMYTLTSTKYENPFESVTHVGTAIFVTNGSSASSSSKTAGAYCLPITLPNVETMDSLAFSESKITELHITSQKITELPSYMCYKTRAMTVCTIPESITTMGSYIFAGISTGRMYLKSINLAKANGDIIENYNGVPDGVTAIPASMLAYNSAMTSFDIHDGVTELGASAFNYCTYMYDFYLSKNVESIGTECFSTQNTSTNVYIDLSIDGIPGAPWGTAANWIIWNGLTIADKLTDAGAIEYQYLINVNEDDTASVLNIRNASSSTYIAGYFAHKVWERNDREQAYYITNIPDSAFYNNSSMQSIYIEEGITHIGTNAFRSLNNCTGAIVIPAGLIEMGEYAFQGISKSNTQSAYGVVTIGEGLEVIPRYAFSGSNRLKAINLPHSIIYVEEYAFYGLADVSTLSFTNRVEFEEGASGLLPIGLNTLYLTGYTSDETIPGYDAIGVSNNSVNVYYADTVEYETDNGIILYHPGTETVSKYIGTDEVVYIPETIEIDGELHTVRYIEDYFIQSSNRTVKEVNVPSTVEDMGENAFVNNSILEILYIDKPEDSIDNKPWGNTNNGLIVLWNNSLRIGDYVYRIRDDGDINIVKYLGKDSYLDVTKFNDLFDEDPGYVITEIHENAFYGNTYVEEIILPDSVNYIGDNAFAYCSNLEDITLPKVMEAYGLGDYVFYYCTSLKEIHIPEGVLHTGDYLGYACSALELVTVPRDVVTIGTMFIRGTPYSNNYMIVQFLDRLESEPLNNESWANYSNFIGPNSYYSGMILYDDRIYQDNWVYSVTQQMVMTYVAYDSNDEYIEFPESFIDRDGNISYPKIIFDSVTGTGTGNSNRYRYNNLQYADEIVIPDGYETINNSAFYGVSMSKITIPDSVTFIGTSVFANLSNLTEIQLPPDIEIISNGLFYGSTALKDVIIPSKVTSIGNTAFYNCSSLEDINIPYGVTSIGSSAFANCTSLTSFYMPDSVTSLGLGAFNGASSLAVINVSKYITEIGSSTFANTAVEVLTFGDALKTIGNLAFNNCENLKTVNIGEYDSAISSISYGTSGSFLNTPSLEYINIGQTREAVGTIVSSNGPWGGK